MAVFQKQILMTAQAAGRPVIVATEMLHTKIGNSFPTKAEVSDITNAVLDGCAATMLSGETAIGKFPEQAVSIMRRIADAASTHQQNKLDGFPVRSSATVPQAIEDAIALICRNLAVTKIVAVTISGYAARMIAARQPRQPILAVSNDARAARGFNLLPGTEGIFIDIPFPRSSTDHIVQCMKELWLRGKLDEDDLVLVTAVGYPRSGNRMNLIQTHNVRDLIETLGWRESSASIALSAE
jgi:pyruvate kinase